MTQQSVILRSAPLASLRISLKSPSLKDPKTAGESEAEVELEVKKAGRIVVKLMLMPSSLTHKRHH